MRRIFLALAAILFVAITCTCVLAADDYAPDEIIVELSPNTIQASSTGNASDISTMTISSASIKTLNSKFKARKMEKVFKDKKSGSSSAAILGKEKGQNVPDLSNYYVIQLGEGDPMAAMQEYKKDPNVVSVSLNYKRNISLVPNDPDFRNLPSYFNQWDLYKMKMIDAWNITTGSPGQIVAVIDTGVNYNHEDLQGKVILGYDYINEDTDPMDDNGHGTHVAGIIGAVANNAKGIAGISWGSNILALKTISNMGWGYATKSSLAIVYAADHGASVINMSYGGAYTTSCERAAIDYAYSKGCVLVAAAGNEGIEKLVYPAAYDHVIAVASTDPNDRKSPYSSFGAFVDISAPGGDSSDDPKTRILSTYYSNPNSYVWMMGTSMAAPHVSGLAALVRSENPNASPDEVERQIKDTADDISLINPAYLGKLGAGRINAFRALNTSTVFSSLQNGSNVSGIVTITGTVTSEHFDHYTIRWARGATPNDGDWSSDGVMLADDGKYSVKEGMLASWFTQGKIGKYSLKLSINDWSSLESTVVVNVGNFKTLGMSESGPNPFNPSIGEVTFIKYDLSAPEEVKLYIFDITGTLIYSKTYPAGDPDGGHAGTNVIEWNGYSRFGGIVANGAYLYKLSSAGQQIGKGKLIILK